MRVKPLPSLELLRQLFVIDATSPSGLSRAGRQAGYKHKRGYWRVCVPKLGAFAVHRIVWSLARGDLIPPYLEIDHINGDRADNSVANLRACTIGENRQNMATSRGRLQGVYLNPKTNRYQSNIYINYKRHVLGTFATEEEAAKAYAAAKQQMHPFCVQERIAKKEPA